MLLFRHQPKAARIRPGPPFCWRRQDLEVRRAGYRLDRPDHLLPVPALRITRSTVSRWAHPATCLPLRSPPRTRVMCSARLSMVSFYVGPAFLSAASSVPRLAEYFADQLRNLMFQLQPPWRSRWPTDSADWPTSGPACRITLSQTRPGTFDQLEHLLCHLLTVSLACHGSTPSQRGRGSIVDRAEARHPLPSGNP